MRLGFGSCPTCCGAGTSDDPGRRQQNPAAAGIALAAILDSSADLLGDPVGRGGYDQLTEMLPHPVHHPLGVHLAALDRRKAANQFFQEICVFILLRDRFGPAIGKDIFVMNRIGDMQRGSIK